MTDFMEIVRGRRSIRKYLDKPVSEQDLATVLEAVKWSPSWANTQCWEVVIVTDPEIKSALQATLPAKGNPAFKAMVQAPVVLVFCARMSVSGYYKGKASTKFGDWFMYDLGIATQNLCLAAHSQGLGTVIVGLFDHDEARKVLNVPDGYELVSMIPMGWPAKTGSAPKRKEPKEFCHQQLFGQ